MAKVKPLVSKGMGVGSLWVILGRALQFRSSAGVRKQCFRKLWLDPVQEFSGDVSALTNGLETGFMCPTPLLLHFDWTTNTLTYSDTY